VRDVEKRYKIDVVYIIIDLKVGGGWKCLVYIGLESVEGESLIYII